MPFYENGKDILPELWLIHVRDPLEIKYERECELAWEQWEQERKNERDEKNEEDWE